MKIRETFRALLAELKYNVIHIFYKQTAPKGAEYSDLEYINNQSAPSGAKYNVIHIFLQTDRS